MTSAPYEDIGTAKDAGLVQTFTVSSSSATTGVQYTESSAGTPGSVATGNRFGLALGAAHGTSENAFMVASPYQADGSVFVVTGTAVRSWVPGVGGVPASATGSFGWSVTGGPQATR